MISACPVLPNLVILTAWAVVDGQLVIFISICFNETTYITLKTKVSWAFVTKVLSPISWFQIVKFSSFLGNPSIRKVSQDDDCNRESSLMRR